MNICAILLDYRGAEKTCKCLESLAGQGLSTAIVVDNSDNDSHTRQLKNSIDQLETRNLDYRVNLTTANKNLGFAGGINFAIANDRNSSTPHDHYLIINNDATAEPGLVEKLHQALLDDEKLLLSAPCIVAPKTEEECGIWYNRYFSLLTKKKTPLSFQYVSGCCMMVDKCLAPGNQLFDPQFFMYGEDAFLCWKLAKEKQKYRLVTDAFVRHEVGASSRKAGVFYEYHTVRGHVLMAVKAFNTPLEVPLMLASKLLTLSLRSLARCIRYRSLVPAYAFFMAWYPFDLKIRNP